MNVAVVGHPGAWSTERLARALRAEGADTSVVDLATCALALPGSGLSIGGRRLGPLDGAVVKKVGDAADGWSLGTRINLLRALQRSGVPVVSEPERLAVAADRYRMTLELAHAGLPMPETVVTDDADEAEAAVRRFGTAVLKPLFTSKGRGMRRLTAADDLPTLLARHRAAHGLPFYLQRFIPHPGRDLGVAVLAGRCLGAYWRVAAPEQWMTTILSGGRYVAADPPADVIDIAERAARHFDLLFTGVDLMETPDGGWTVLEVSAFGGFRGLSTALGLDAAPLVARAALERLAAAVAS
jgi:tetrahydromethanopterin:alpha-L-glutamate ligase